MYTTVIGIKRMIVGGDAADRVEPGHGHRDPGDAAAGAGGDADAAMVRQGPGGYRKIDAMACRIVIARRAQDLPSWRRNQW